MTRTKNQKKKNGRPANALPAKGLTKVQKLAKAIRDARGEKPVPDLAKAARISAPRWYAFERGEVSEQPPIATLWAIEKSLKLAKNALASIIYSELKA